MAAKIRRDDEVIVLTGKDKGKRGKVKMFCLPANSSLKVSTAKKHQKPVPALNQPAASLKKKPLFRFLTLQSSMRLPVRLTV